MTALPSLDTLPLAMLAPLPDEYTIRRGDVVQFAYVGNRAWRLVGTVVKVLAYGVAVVETAERARFKVPVEECVIIVTKACAEVGR